MGIFAPKWMSGDKARAMEAIQKESDPEKLRKAAEKAPVGDVRIRALSLLKDEAAFQKAALSDPDWEVRRYAAGKVRDQDTLKRVAGQDRALEVRMSAILGIKDELYRIVYAQKINDSRLASAAAEGVKSEMGLALLAADCDKDYIVKKCLEKLKAPSKETLDILRRSKSAPVKEFLLPYADEQTRFDAVRSGTDPWKQERLIDTLTDPEKLYRLAVEIESLRVRKSAFRRLKALYEDKKTIPDAWWKKHIDPDTEDQRMAVQAKKSAKDPAAAAELAERLANESCDEDYLLPRLTMPVIERLENMLRGGNEKAGKALYRIYRSSIDRLDPALLPYAREQTKRTYQKHRDAMVDSYVCGETFRHEDSMYGAFTEPLK